MSREIKFRIFEPLNKKMCYLDFALYNHDSFAHQNHWVLPVGRQCSGRDYTNMNLDAVDKMQHIGIIDKNGKEIYEGDIIIVATYSHEEPLIDTTCVVEYDDDYCLYEFVEIGEDGIYSYSMIEIRDSFKYELEVIGNKYENPELLVGEE